VSEAALKDKIDHLPDAPTVDFEQYSGYIDIDVAHNKSLFYWLQECSIGGEFCPVVFWTNGGPGCSGLIGAVLEQGAFRIQSTGELSMNPGRWNQIANMVFIEQPIGVGFSFSDDPSDYYVGDKQAVYDMFQMIQGFFKVFPNLKDNDFYIASESYGGHYMPMLATYIVDHNANNSINFKGFLVGNPYTNPIENAKGTYDTWYGHQLLSRPLWSQWFHDCDDGNNMSSTHCQSLMHQMEVQVSDVYPYGLDWPVCNSPQSLYRFKERRWFMDKVLQQGLGRRIPFQSLESTHRNLLLEDPSEFEFEPCATDYMTTYYNRQDVQVALHAKLGTMWTMCSNATIYNETDSNNDMVPYYQYLINGGFNLHIMIYSGDDDSVCGTLGTQSWIWPLNYEVESKWNSWKYDEQTAGYFVRFKDAFTFVTVHSAGHQVPWYLPSVSYRMFEKYFTGEF